MSTLLDSASYPSDVFSPDYAAIGGDCSFQENMSQSGSFTNPLAAVSEFG